MSTFLCKHGYSNETKMFTAVKNESRNEGTKSEELNCTMNCGSDSEEDKEWVKRLTSSDSGYARSISSESGNDNADNNEVDLTNLLCKQRSPEALLSAKSRVKNCSDDEVFVKRKGQSNTISKSVHVKDGYESDEEAEKKCFSELKGKHTDTGHNTRLSVSDEDSSDSGNFSSSQNGKDMKLQKTKTVEDDANANELFKKLFKVHVPPTSDYEADNVDVSVHSVERQSVGDLEVAEKSKVGDLEAEKSLAENGDKEMFRNLFSQQVAESHAQKDTPVLKSFSDSEVRGEVCQVRLGCVSQGNKMAYNHWVGASSPTSTESNHKTESPPSNDAVFNRAVNQSELFLQINVNKCVKKLKKSKSIKLWILCKEKLAN